MCVEILVISLAEMREKYHGIIVNELGLSLAVVIYS